MLVCECARLDEAWGTPARAMKGDRCPIDIQPSHGRTTTEKEGEKEEEEEGRNGQP